jgi:flagellar hook-basal body complex protein FliE
MAGILPVGATSALGGLSQLNGAAGLGSGLGTGSSTGLSANVGGAANSAAPAAGAGTTAPDAASAGSSFVDSLGSAMKNLNTQLTSADAQMADFAAGGSADLQTVMLEMQEASIGLKVGIAVRDKLLEAYQEVMRLSI